MGKATARCHAALPLSWQGSSASFLDAFQRGERKMGISPSGIVLTVDVTEKDSPQSCV